MKYIKIFEDFSEYPQINETKITQLPGGFININIDGSLDNSDFIPKKSVVYFRTNTTIPEKNLGNPGTLDISVIDGQTNTLLTFPSDSFVDADRVISMKTKDFKKTTAGQGSKHEILARNPAEATEKAYEILAAVTYLTTSPAEPKMVGNIIKSFFEIRKLYPSYMSKNTLFKGFLQGIINGFSNPNFGEYSKYDDWSSNIRDRKYNEEIRKVLTEAGVIKAST